MRPFGKVVALALGAALLVINTATAQEGLVQPAPFPAPLGGLPAQPGGGGAPPAGPGAGPAIVPPALPQAAITPPPLPVAPVVVFFVEQGGMPAGPFNLADLEQRIKAGTLKGETLVWKQGSPAWVAAKDVPELQTVLAAIPPPMPQGEQYKRLLVGTWQSQTRDQFGVTTNSTLTYSADGTYSGVVTQSFQGYQIPQVANGTWTVNPVKEGSFSLTMNPGGATGAAFPVTVVLRVVDTNTLANDADRYQAQRIR